MFIFYEDYFKKELDYCRREHFTGSLEFRVNFKEGRIGNMNISVNQSVKYNEDRDGKHIQAE